MATKKIIMVYILLGRYRHLCRTPSCVPISRPTSVFGLKLFGVELPYSRHGRGELDRLCSLLWWCYVEDLRFYLFTWGVNDG